MIKISQYFLLIFLIFISFIFYKKILTKKQSADVFLNNVLDVEVSQSNNSVIKNLNYSILLNDKVKYEISAKSSEIMTNDREEIVNMQNVLATITDKNKQKIILMSDNAIYNNNSNNSHFQNNVKIEYLDQKIFSDQAKIDFEKKLILIYDNVYYTGSNNTLKADNIKYNLITKETDITMYKSDKNVKAVINNAQY
jgi:lipopolysaccharide export system protein LptA